jgi:DnaJ-class molecular chaperone
MNIIQLPSLEKNCSDCNGTGILNYCRLACDECDGTGKVPSDFGWEVYNFVTRTAERQRRMDEREG